RRRPIHRPTGPGRGLGGRGTVRRPGRFVTGPFDGARSGGRGWEENFVSLQRIAIITQVQGGSSLARTTVAGVAGWWAWRGPTHPIHRLSRTRIGGRLPELPGRGSG